MQLLVNDWKNAITEISGGIIKSPYAMLLASFFEKNYDFPGSKGSVCKGYETILEKFLKRYGHDKVFLARAPGRINLIGEHTDYNGCPVLPMAINRDMVAFFSLRFDGKIVINNVEERFSERSFYLEKDIAPYTTGDWGNYCKAAVQGLLDYYFAKNFNYKDFKGMNVMLWGNIPPAAGMSSSSALVVLMGLMFLEANHLSMDKLELAQLMAVAERYVGTQGGGMDQAASLLGKYRNALKIDFNPFAVSLTEMPPGYTVIVANSMVQAPKTESAMDNYNRRAIECRLATAIIRKKFSDKFKRDIPIKLIGDLSETKLGIPQMEIEELASRIFHEESYGINEIAAILNRDVDEVYKNFCLRRDGRIFYEPADGFKLQKRFRHIMTEWKRVECSLEFFKKGNMVEFGKLMDQSHTSCRDDYEISCPELDKLVEISKKAGSLGSRLTGAGFGGCTVSLVEESKSKKIMDQIIEEYYKDYKKEKLVDFSSLIFACKAVDGAGILFKDKNGNH